MLPRHTLIFLCLLSLALQGVPPSNGSGNGLVMVVNLKGVITVASYELVAEALDSAEQLGASALVIVIDTPGGAWEATQGIIGLIERSNIPVIAYVHPRGATAWSAGTYIVVSSHVAAMTPYSIMGSCQPRMYPTGEPVEDPKLVNAFTEYLVQRAKMHGRNATLAEEFVRLNRNVGAEEAGDLGMVEVLASSLEELLVLVDGRSVEMPTGETGLMTRGAEVHHYSPSVRVRVLGFISDPNIAYVLFIVGVYGIIFGFSAAGFEGEIIGTILLVLGLIGLGFYVDVLIVGLLLLGGVFIYLEIREPAAEIFGPAGVFCLVAGSLLMLRFDPSSWLISPEWYWVFMVTVILLVAIMSGFSIFVLYKIIKAVKQTPVALGFVGEKATAIDELGPGKEGFVRFHGELWRARSEVPIKPGERVRVIAKEGLILTVEPEGVDLG